ncbi:MAG: hypothetical protein ACRESX_09795 [Gammaproteobacteria bacterium]
MLPVLFGTGCAGTEHADSPASVATSTKITPVLASAARQLQSNDGRVPLDGLVRSDSQGRIQVYVYVDTDPAEVMSALSARGLQDALASPVMHIVQGWVKPQDLSNLAALPFVTRITPPRYAQPRKQDAMP